MKTILARMAVLGVAVVTMAVPAFAGQTQSEREMPKGNAGGKAAHEARIQTPDTNDWGYRSALETGNLPSKVIVPSAGSGREANVPTVEVGGIVYRVGIDTK
jgi:hypothetical protein